MKPRTHLAADPSFCGRVAELAEGSAVVVLETSDAMVVDAQRLVHGGFVFGVADYAAMLAVNDPNVVLGSAQTRFLRPVRGGASVTARAKVTAANDRKREVAVEASVGSERVFEGTFVCFVLERHVLDGVGSE
jgi:acyl-coenzyme A thioesterase PaaI-like protein